MSDLETANKRIEAIDAAVTAVVRAERALDRATYPEDVVPTLKAANTALATAIREGVGEPQQRVAELEAELAAMRAGGEPVAYRHLWPADDECGTAAYWEYFDSPTGEDCADCQPLYTHPQPAAQDAELLDWLEKCGSVAIERCKYLGSDDLVIEVTPYNDDSYDGDTLRAAIAAAIAAQQGDSHE